jgi:hypothetical protein
MMAQGKKNLPPMLTTAELRFIQSNAPTPAVKRLLWDIFALRAAVRQAKQVSEHLGDAKRFGAPLDVLLSSLREELKDFPFLEEDRLERNEILYGHGEKKKPKGIDNH